MPNNPITKLIGDYLIAGKRIKSILVVKKANPDELLFVLDRNKRERHFTKPKTHAEFMSWWKEATAYLKIKLAKLPKAKEPAKKKKPK